MDLCFEVCCILACASPHADIQLAPGWETAREVLKVKSAFARPHLVELRRAALSPCALRRRGAACVSQPTMLCCSGWGVVRSAAKCGLRVQMTMLGTVAIFAQGVSLGCCDHQAFCETRGRQLLAWAWHCPPVAVVGTAARSRQCGALLWGPRVGEDAICFSTSSLWKLLPERVANRLGWGIPRLLCFRSQFYRHSFFQRGQPCST